METSQLEENSEQITLIEKLNITPPDAIACFCGSVRQPVINPQTDEFESDIHDRKFAWDPANYQQGQDPHLKDTFGTGGKTNTMATMRLYDALEGSPCDMITFTSWSNLKEKVAMSTDGNSMPSSAAIYTEYLYRLGLPRDISVIECDQEWVNNTFTTIVALVEQIANHPDWENVSIITLNFHLPRVIAFLDVLGLNNPDTDYSYRDSTWLFRNFQMKHGGPTSLYKQFTDSMKILSEREKPVQIAVLGSERILLEDERLRYIDEKDYHFFPLFNYVYPPIAQDTFIKLNTIEREVATQIGLQIIDNDDLELSPIDLEDLNRRRDLLLRRIRLEANGVKQINDKTYWT